MCLIKKGHPRKDQVSLCALCLLPLNLAQSKSSSPFLFGSLIPQVNIARILCLEKNRRIITHLQVTKSCREEEEKRIKDLLRHIPCFGFRGYALPIYWNETERHGLLTLDFSMKLDWHLVNPIRRMVEYLHHSLNKYKCYHLSGCNHNSKLVIASETRNFTGANSVCSSKYDLLYFSVSSLLCSCYDSLWQFGSDLCDGGTEHDFTSLTCVKIAQINF